MHCIGVSFTFMRLSFLLFFLLLFWFWLNNSTTLASVSASQPSDPTCCTATCEFPLAWISSMHVSAPILNRQPVMGEQGWPKEQELDVGGIHRVRPEMKECALNQPGHVVSGAQRICLTSRKTLNSGQVSTILFEVFSLGQERKGGYLQGHKFKDQAVKMIFLLRSRFYELLAMFHPHIGHLLSVHRIGKNGTLGSG
ncbi:hypothetical protein QBC37DRAFT_394041 [Rhypophila decipiens]|uniref:Secreted protein n=1 Tax=Rhypophila decipiens TaxID=261697 RepID=A0AAN6YJJ7_9PEZI|nr:hypothetical protein QBC37DRAFT_394041 [Rhypophila decipiens]